MTEESLPLERARRTALWGQWFTAFVILLLGIAMGAFVVFLTLGLPEAGSDFTEVMDLPDDVMPELALQRLLIALLWMAPDMAGLVMAILAFRMFRGFRGGGFLTLATARRLRLIGIAILSIAPLRILPEACAIALYGHWTPPEGSQITLSLEDTDIYALVIGLIILATGHIMAQAVEISEENKSFV